MAGVPMVQLYTFPSGKHHNHSHLHYCKHCQELRLAQTIQPSAFKRKALMVTLFCISYIPFGYYVVTGNEYALVLWMALLAITAVVL